MNGSRLRALLLWSVCIVIAAIVVVRARYITDLSAFLPDKPTPTQQLLVDQLRDGPASRRDPDRHRGRRCGHARETVAGPGGGAAQRCAFRPGRERRAVTEQADANSCSCIATC